jgi:D-cysteine desulfhydrase
MGLVIHHIFPQLEKRFPSCGLIEEPTPLLRMENLGRIVDHGDLWVKRDDMTSGLYGGNKIRKLDFLLARARASGVRAVVTSGAQGSHHVLATCVHGRRLCFDVSAVLFAVPMDDHLRENQLRIDELASWKVLQRSALLLPLGTRAWRRAKLREGYGPGELAIIPPGGSSATGCMGYVNAALEVEGQREAMGLPPFDEVFTALGTCGTLSGLAVGFQLAGSTASVVGVRVATPLVANRWTAAMLVRQTQAMIREALPPGPQRALLSAFPRGTRIEAGYLGRGYALYGREETRVMAMLRAEEGIALDPVYTAKAMRAFLERARSSGGKKRKLLFTLTCDNAIKWGGPADEAVQTVQ